MSIIQDTMDKLTSAYPTVQIDERTISSWKKQMLQYPSSVISRAVDQIIQDCVEFPSVAAFKRQAESERTNQQKINRSAIQNQCTRCINGWTLDREQSGVVNHKGNPISHDYATPCPVCLPGTHANWKAGFYLSRQGIGA